MRSCRHCGLDFPHDRLLIVSETQANGAFGVSDREKGSGCGDTVLVLRPFTDDRALRKAADKPPPTGITARCLRLLPPYISISMCTGANRVIIDSVG
jgi:hypothetical protein